MTTLTWLILSVIGGLVIFAAFIVTMACMNASQIDCLNEASITESRVTSDEFQEMMLDSQSQAHLYPDNIKEVIYFDMN